MIKMKQFRVVERNENKLSMLFCLFSVLVCLGHALVTIKDKDVPELEYMDPTVDPCEDFYEFSCGNFKNLHPLGEDKVVDQFTVLTEKIMKSMIYTLKNTNTTFDSEALNKVKTAFHTCLDLNITDSKKPFPEVHFLNEIGGMPLFKTPTAQSALDWKQIGKLTAKYGVSLFFRITVIPYPLTATDNLIRVEKDDLQTYLSELNGENTSFTLFLKKFFTMLRDHINIDVKDEDIDNAIQEIKQFMQAIQNPSGVPAFEPLSTTTVGGLQKWTDEQFENGSPIVWIDYLDAVFGEAGVEVKNTTDIYVNSTHVYNVLNVFKNTRPDIVKNFVLMRILLFSAMDSNWMVRKALEDYYKTKNMTLHSREEYCVRQLIDIEQSDIIVGLSLASGRLFAENDDGEDRLSKARTMTKDLAGTFARFIMDSEWIDTTSKSSAIEKAKKMVALIGLPEFFENNTALDKLYETLEIKKLDSYGNSQRIMAFKQAYMFSQVGKPRNRARWDRSPFDTNAYYNRGNNKITIPFAMMNPVFFDGKLSLMDYSHLGSLVGHEIIHGFDNTGRKYDGDGMMNDIWTEQTLNAYQEKIKCFEDQYNRFIVSELNRTVDGTASLNENLADNGGVRVSYAASKKFFGNFKLESGKYTAEQLFFIGFGTTFCSTETVEHLEYSLGKGYAPSKYRVIGALSNMEEFSRAFNCPKGSTMNPMEKCSLW